MRSCRRGFGAADEPGRAQGPPTARRSVPLGWDGARPHAELLVLGRSQRGSPTRTLAGAPAAAVVAAARCPVLVVPEPARRSPAAGRRTRPARRPA
ncbi:universal stress protein [Pseudonocardia yuanmonensis]|uniref:universal stress protein n=1 Tax=Pseudonocardia yuanmonensis TaxID=1095914 RepID=UPI003CD08A33